jgi:hypothetical protein
MAVAGVEHRDAGGEVDVFAAFDVPQRRVLGALGIEAAHHAHAARRGREAAGLEFGVGGHG